MSFTAPASPAFLTPFVLYQSALLNAYTERLIHGFSGKPLSLGGPACTPEEARANRLALCETWKLPTAHLALPRQTHTNRWRLNDENLQEEADAIIVTKPGITAMVQVADCVPVILYNPKQHVGAVIHAGWRGTAQQITATTAQALFEQTGARPEETLAAIGPSAGGCCYEVSQEVTEAIQRSIPHVAATEYQHINANGKAQLDLKQANRWQLQAVGVQQVEIIPACTICETERLWSYRRGEAGRQVGFLTLF